MDHRDLVAQSMEELRLKTAAHDSLWHLGQADWSVDQDTGKIVFTAPNGVSATCDVQIVGTFDTVNSTWMWAWDHPSVQPGLAAHATRLREYRQSSGLSDLTTRQLSATEEQCWEFTALACKLNEAQGGYRGPAGTVLVFMTFGQPQITGEVQADAGEDHAAPLDAEFTDEIPADVRSRVTGFITALHDWEVAAYQTSEEEEEDESTDSMDMAQSTYDALIRQWCVSDVQTQGVSYGSDPDHSPDGEQLIAAALSGDRCRVRTRHTNSMDFSTDYEYHLRQVDGEWLFEQIYYVDGSDKFEML